MLIADIRLLWRLVVGIARKILRRPEPKPKQTFAKVDFSTLIEALEQDKPELILPEKRNTADDRRALIDR